MYFVLFTTMLILLLWALQVFFLNTFYESMKSQQTSKIINTINETYSNSSPSQFLRKVENVADSNDLYVYLVDSNGVMTSFQPSEEVAGAGFYYQQINTVRKYLKESPDGSVQLRIKGVDNTKEVLAYGAVLDSPGKATFSIYLVSPLWPVKSTIGILTNQLLYVTFIALTVACILSVYLSTRITRPIREIARSAERLGSGEYGIVFRGGHYTEINNLADTLTSASIELEKSYALQKNLVANVSHDLRTPLTMIRSYAEMIRDLSGNDPVKREKHLQVIIDETDRLNNLVEDLLAVSRMQSGKMTLNVTEFNLSETARAIVSTYEIRNEEGYNISLDCPSEFYVSADEEKIKQVITNLINNAVKFCGDDRQVKVSLSRSRVHSSVICRVEDHGIGIAGNELEHVWDRYYKASSNMVRSTEGSGLGLSIVKEIMVLHRAEYGVDSTLGQGTVFWFELPLSRIDQTAVKPEFTLSDGSILGDKIKEKM